MTHTKVSKCTDVNALRADIIRYDRAAKQLEARGEELLASVLRNHVRFVQERLDYVERVRQWVRDGVCEGR